MERISVAERMRQNYDIYDQPTVDLLDSLKVVGAITANGINRQLTRVLNKHPELRHDLHHATAFMKKASFVERLVALVENRDEQPMCLRCGKPSKYSQPRGSFNLFCDSRCSGNYVPRNDTAAGGRRTASVVGED
jgi:hypothetical protein